MKAEVTREYTVGTVGCESKPHVLRHVVKQSCGVADSAASLQTSRNLLDGHLTPEGATRLVTYPARGPATRVDDTRCGSSLKLNTNNKKERRVRDSSQP